MGCSYFVMPQKGGFVPREAEAVVGDDSAKAVVTEIIHQGRGVFLSVIS
jgi:hypothetical protein